MAQTDNTAIRNAFFGLLVMFGIFILASWLFDRFTGRGVNAEEKVPCIAVYPPAVPESQWGDANNGLKCKLSFNPPAPSEFVDISINIQLENITDDTIVFLFDPNEILKSVSAVNRDKWKLKLIPIPREIFFYDPNEIFESVSAMNRDEWKSNQFPIPRKIFVDEAEYDELYKVSVHTIKPGEIFDREIKCQIDNVVKDTGFTYGFFNAVCKLNIDKSKMSQVQSESAGNLWTGRIESGVTKIYLTMPHDGGCNDCHGDADYHHGVLQDCRFCHAESTDILHETCVRCHKRDKQKIYGRRRVLGPEGDFDNLSKHIPGLIEDENCLVCHDMTIHGYGTVFLADLNSCEKRTFTNEYTEFCLSCHNSNPPESVQFPEKSVKTEPVDYSDLLETYGNSEDESDHSEDNPFSGLSSFSELNSFSEFNSSSQDANDNSYPEVTFTPEESSGYQGVESTMAELIIDSEAKFHSDTRTSVYDKSDFINSDLYKKNVECTDCHRSHGSNRPSLLKNVHGPDDKVRI